jgi:hypothetical protein
MDRQGCAGIYVVAESLAYRMHMSASHFNPSPPMVVQDLSANTLGKQHSFMGFRGILEDLSCEHCLQMSPHVCSIALQVYYNSSVVSVIVANL